jgi:hypothetical protein
MNIALFAATSLAITLPIYFFPYIQDSVVLKLYLDVQRPKEAIA